MKTKSEEKQIIESYQTVIQQLNTSRPALVDLLDAADNYVRNTRAASVAGVNIAQNLLILAKSQESDDIEKTFFALGKTLKEVEEKREEIAKTMFNEIYQPIKKYLENDKKLISDMEMRHKKSSKEFEEKIKIAEANSKKVSKSKDALQASIKEISDLVTKSQEVHLNALKSAMLIQRGRYCSIAAHFAPLSKVYSNVGSLESQISAKHFDELTALGASTSKLPQGKQEMLAKKKRTLIDIANISSDWKRVFQNAGIKKSDLRDANTARYILETIEKATGQKIDFPGIEALDDYQDPGFGAPPPPGAPPMGPPPPGMAGGKPQQAQFGALGLPPPAPHRVGDPPAPPTNRFTPPPPPRNEPVPPPPSRSQNVAIPPAPAPGPSIGSPLMGTVPSAPETPVGMKASSPPVQTERKMLLDQIAQGTTLRKTEPAQLPDISTNDNAGLAGILKNAMLARREAVVDDDDDDDDEWSD